MGKTRIELGIHHLVKVRGAFAFYKQNNFRAISVRHNHTGAKTRETELSKLIRTKAKQFLHWWGTALIWMLFFSPILWQFRPIPRASWRMDGSGSSCCSFQNCYLMRFLQSSNANREYFGAPKYSYSLRLGIRKKLNIPKNWVGGRWFPAEPGKHNVLNITQWGHSAFPQTWL